MNPHSEHPGTTDVSWREPIATLARDHLPRDLAASWIALLRPAFVLDLSEDGPVIGRLGGLPRLPEDHTWPQWRLSPDLPPMPLPYLAGLDCAAVPHDQLDITLPRSGTLHFFASQGCCAEKPVRHQGSRVYYVPAGVPTRECAEPPNPFEERVVYEPVDLRARLIGTAPSMFSAYLCSTFWHPDPSYDFPYGYSWIDVAASHITATFPPAFTEAVNREAQHPGHRLGGWAPTSRWSPENAAWPRPDYPFRDLPEPGGRDPAPGHLLFAVDGSHFDAAEYFAHWIIRPDDLAAYRFDRAWFSQTRRG